MTDKKLFKRTYKFICLKCRGFTHTDREYCEICGARHAIAKAEKSDYKTYFKKKNED